MGFAALNPSCDGCGKAWHVTRVKKGSCRRAANGSAAVVSLFRAAKRRLSAASEKK
jgi:hypothetical protein